MPRHHEVSLSDINPRRLSKIMKAVHERQPQDFEALLGVPGVGGKTVRSLALIAELVYGAPTCRRDITRRWTPRDPATRCGAPRWSRPAAIRLSSASRAGYRAGQMG